MYAKGEGVARNYVLAYMWVNLARAYGSPYTTTLHENLGKRMTREDISTAQRLATEWQEKHRKE